MLIRDRIFNKLEELDMTQKEFSRKTGIAESTISDWRKKRTNPTAEKIMIICKVLEVTPEWLLSGIEAQGERGNLQKWLVGGCTDRYREAGRVLQRHGWGRAGEAFRVCGSPGRKDTAKQEG